ncbi:MAG: membrane-bound O-acyltransferase family protein, partial [Nereida ignava]
TFLIWGAWHGAWLAIERALGAKGAVTVWPRGTAWIITMLIVIVGWVVFRAETIGQAFDVYAGMAGLNGWAMSADQAWRIQNTEIAALLIGGFLSVGGAMMLRLVDYTPASLRAAGTFSLMVIASAALLAQTHSPFLYFQF